MWARVATTTREGLMVMVQGVHEGGKAHTAHGAAGARDRLKIGLL